MDNNAISWTPIIVSIISSVGGIIGAYLAVRRGSQEQEIKNAQREQRQADRLDSIDEKIKRLEKKVDAHNEYGRKFGEVATSLVSMAKDIEYLKRK
jgi:hypothetical protein